MKRNIASILLTLLITIHCCIAALAHPAAIVEKTFELPADTIFVKESTAGASYTVEYTNPQSSSSGNYKIFPLRNSATAGGYAVIKVDISSVKAASDFTLKFSLITSSVKDNVLSIYCASYQDGENLVSGLTPGSTKTVASNPNIYYTVGELVYKYTTTGAGVERPDVELLCESASSSNPVMVGSVLETHINNAIDAGESSVYFVVKVLGTQYFYLYNSASSDKAPSLTVTGSTISSETVKIETGYTYKLGNLKSYTDGAIVFVAAYDGTDTLINVATSGEKTVTEGTTIDVEIPCPEAAKLKAYICKTGTLEPVTYVETISVAE